MGLPLVQEKFRGDFSEVNVFLLRNIRFIAIPLSLDILVTGERAGVRG